MKIKHYLVQTKAFKVRIRVQNGRIVHAPSVIGSFKKCLLSELEGWLERNHPRAFLTELKEMKAKEWAEAVANCWCKFSDVPEKYKEKVKALLSTLLDLNAPLPPITMHSMTYKE